MGGTEQDKEWTGCVKKGGFCFYCRMYGSIPICIRIYKLSFAWGLPVWYILVVLIQSLDQKANVFILGIPVIIENFPRDSRGQMGM